MGNLAELNWPEPWYSRLFDFIISPYVLPFTLTAIVFLLILIIGFISTRTRSL